jgi:hypothetical protein
MQVALWPAVSVIEPLGAQPPLITDLNRPGLALAATSPTEWRPVEVTIGPMLAPHLTPWKTFSSRFSWKRVVTPAGLQRLMIVICAVCAFSPLRTLVIVQVADAPAATVTDPSAAQSPPITVV